MLPLVSIVTVPLTARLVLPSTEAAERADRCAVRRHAGALFQLLPLLIGVAVAGTKLPSVVALTPRVFSQIVFLLTVVVGAGSVEAPKFASGVAAVYGLARHVGDALHCDSVDGHRLASSAGRSRRTAACWRHRNDAAQTSGSPLGDRDDELPAEPWSSRPFAVAYLLFQFLIVTIVGILFHPQDEVRLSRDAADILSSSASRRPHPRRLHFADRRHDERVQRRASRSAARPLPALHRHAGSSYWRTPAASAVAASCATFW